MGKWKLLAGAGVLALAGFIAWLMVERIGDEAFSRGELVERGKWQAERAARDKADAKALADAVVKRANELLARQPVINNSYRTVNEYAATADGAELCLPAVRLPGILETRRGLFGPAEDAAGPFGPLPSDLPAESP